MSTPLQSSARSDSRNGLHVVARRSEVNDSDTRQAYGAEDLPVLIRLPDLSAQGAAALVPVAEPRVPSTAPTSDDGRDDAGDDAGDDGRDDAGDDGRDDGPDDAGEPALETHEEGTDSQVSDQLRRDRHKRRSRRVVMKARPAAWIRNAGQLGFAAVLAGILFAIIVTVKQWNTADPDAASPAGFDRVEAPEIDFGQPVLEPAANLTPDPGLDPPLQSVRSTAGVPSAAAPDNLHVDHAHEFQNVPDSDGRLPRASNLRLARETRRPPAAGYADSPSSSDGYPTTGIAPVSSDGGRTRRAAVEGWRETMPGAAVRNAERSRQDIHSQHR